MRRWLRLTLPPDTYVGAIAVLYALFEFGPRALGIGGHGGNKVIELAVVSYAAYRVLAFHPIFIPEYRIWLARTPWTIHLPLPVGPVHLVAQDALVVGLLAGVAWLEHPAIRVPHLVVMFLFSYEVCMALSFAVLRMRWFAYLTAFGLGLLCLFWNSDLAALKVAVVLYSTSFVGLRRALTRFSEWQWSDDQQFQPLSLEKAVDRAKQKILGWPFDIIRSKDVAPAIAYRDGFMLSLLLGWWLFVAVRRIGAGVPPAAPIFITALISQFAVFIRVAIYCWGYFPPISVWGRIFTLRWIVPGYDRVFLTPLVTMLVTTIGLAAPSQWAIDVDVAVSVTLSLVFMTTLNLGPSLLTWRLTGNHRLSPATLMANSKAEVVQV
ncbi:MAG TPA: hypothetical protein VKU82_10700 [Planctomycetaceae bacterium]|nr:hypothetical protein [Planctomycetaceae bacterium]